MQNIWDSQDKEWFPHHVIYGEDSMALLILNQPLSEESKDYLRCIWKSAVFRVAVDGGTNELRKMSITQSELLPDLICGDFDSVTPENLEFYRKKGVDVVHTPDQDETDFTKALRLTSEYTRDKHLQISSIVALSKNGDRLDHIFGNLNTLYLSPEIISVPVFLLGQGSLTWLLSAGSHKIHITEKMVDSHIGLIPLGNECTNVTTTGLKWNLTKDKMKFGGLISTCNLLENNLVTVSTDTPLVWTMEINLKQNTNT